MNAVDNRVVAVLATMDTKGAECGYLKDEIERLGGTALLIDIGVIGDADLPVDVTNTAVAERGGTSLAELRLDPSREVASEVMVNGAIAILTELLGEQRIHAVLGLGGTQGTNNGSQIMQAMPYGFPKVLLSTMASGDTSGFVGIKDITMMFSVSDILGLNPFFRQILSNAAGAAVGMAGAAQSFSFSSDKPVIGITNLGALTRGTMRAIELFAERGYETIVFHAVGSGGRAMEQLMRDGIIQAVFDFALGDIVDALFDGIRAADADRLTVACELNLPQVIVPGGVDHIGILLKQANTVPERYRERQHTFHNPVILVPRTSAEELVSLAHELGRRLVDAPADAVFLLPTQGLSSYSVAGGALEDTTSDAAFFTAIHQTIPPLMKLVAVEAAAEDDAFITRAVDELIALIESRAG